MSVPSAATEPGLGIPDDLRIDPVSRRPTRLREETLERILSRPIPAFPKAARTDSSVSVVIPTRDNLPFLRLCVESLLATGEACEVIVLDNASSDGTAEYLARLAERNLSVVPVRNPTNRAFAAAINQGASMARGEMLAFLNDDTAITSGMLLRLISHLRSSVGMVGPTTNRTGNEAQIDCDYTTWGGLVRFADARAKCHAGSTFEIETLTMFCVALHRSLYTQIGPLDERFETGMLEDDDYSRRVRLAGHSLLCADDCFVHHFGETSFGRLVGSGEYSRVLDANKTRFEEKWGEPWRPYGRRQSRPYRAMTNALRSAVEQAVPRGSTVLVVSRGDEELLRIEGLRTRHFPSEADGSYSGHHPGDSAEAIAAIETERAAGAGYIVFPSTALWWLDHYEDLGRRLREGDRQIDLDTDSCVIFELGRADA